MKILLSAYRCSPYDVSDAFLAFKWLEILIRKYEVILLTTCKNDGEIKRYFSENFPKTLKVFGFDDKHNFKKNKILTYGIKIGYFSFNLKVYNFLKSNIRMLDYVDLIFHKTPSSFRFFTSLSKFNKPLIIGPLGGGLKPPEILKKYFSKEPILFKLRTFDNILFKTYLIKRQLDKAHKIFIALDYLRDIIPKKYEDKLLTVMDVGISCDEFIKKEKYGNAVINILFVGRLTRYKGPEFLIKAFKNLDFLTDQLILNIVGDGEERENLIKLVSKLNLENRVSFHGNLNRDGVKNQYERASIFCFPSITESMGIVLLEAMCYELPLIVIDNGGPKYLCPSEGAIKIPLGDEENIIENLTLAMNRLINNNELRKKMGKYNRRYCENNYDWKILEKNILNIFDDIEQNI